jgi:hypothetical protein
LRDHHPEEGPKGGKGALRPDFQANTFCFKKKPVSPQGTGRRLEGNLGIVTDVELMMSEHCEGRRDL